MRRLLLCALLVLSGCGFKDIDKRFFVVTIGVDPAENLEGGYKVTLKLAIPNAGPTEGTPNALLVSQEAYTIAESIRLIKSRVDKELDFGHAKLIILGKQLVRKDVRDVLDWFTRRRDIQKIAWIAAGSPSAKAVLQQKPTAERLPSDTLFQLFGNTGTESPYIVSVYLFDFLRRLHEPGLTPVLPVIQTGEESVYEVNRAILLRNGKTVLTLGREETKILNMLMQDYDRTDVKVKGEETYFMLSTDKISKSFSIHTPIAARPYISFQVKMRGIIEESRHPLREQHLQQYSQTASEQSEERMLKLLQKLQKKKVDPLGLGLRFRARHIGDEEKLVRVWEKVYRNAKFRVKVKTDIQGTGMFK